jgi:hypothetical protein
MIRDSTGTEQSEGMDAGTMISLGGGVEVGPGAGADDGGAVVEGSDVGAVVGPTVAVSGGAGAAIVGDPGALGDAVVAGSVARGVGTTPAIASGMVLEAVVAVVLWGAIPPIGPCAK